MSDNAVSAQVSPRRWRRPPSPRRRKYAIFRASQMLDENVALDLPSKGGFVRTMVELEAEAERQSLIYAKRARFYSSLYYLFGLPAAILAAIAGATVLASTTGRLAAGIIALTSSALSAAVVFLDSGEQRDRATKTRSYWDDLYNDIHIARLTKLASYTVYDGPEALNSFYMRASSIRAGRNPADEVGRTAGGVSSGNGPPPLLFPPAS